MLQAPMPVVKEEISEPEAGPLSAFARMSGSCVAELNLQEFLGEGPDFLLPLDFRQDMLAFNTQAEGAEQPTRSDTYFSRSSSYDASSSCNIALAARAASSPASGLPPTALPPMTFAATKTLPEAGQTALTALLHSSPVDGANDAQISSDEDMEPDMKGSHRSGGTSGAGPHINMSIAQLEAKRHTMSEKEYKRLRRRITNRESAQRMRLKRQEEMADVVQKLGSMQQENARLRELQLGMVQLLQRMKREAVQWQVRAQGAQRQNAMLMQQMVDKQIPADAAATVRVSASADICTPADSDANVPPPTRAASPLPATLAPTALANFMGELYPDGLSSPMRHSSDVLLTLPLALGGRSGPGQQ